MKGVWVVRECIELFVAFQNYTTLIYSTKIHTNNCVVLINWIMEKQTKAEDHAEIKDQFGVVSLALIFWTIASSSDVRRSKLLSGSASCDLYKSPISILQKKAIGELYPMVPVSSCAFNVCGIYAHFNFFPYKLPLKKNVNALRLYCTDS